MKTRWRGLLQLFTVCLLLLGTSAVASAQSVAMATDVAGTVTSGGKSVSILSEIAADARVELAAGARLVAVYLQGGDEYAFSGPAQVQFRSPEPQVLSGAKPQKRASPLGKGVAVKPVNVTQAAFVMRSGRNTARIKLLSLSGTRTLDAAPEFRWQEIEPGTQYRFELTDETGKSLHETTAQGGSLNLPASVQLREGGHYMWELSARLADGRRYVSTGDFSVATADVRARAESMRPSSGAPVSQRVAYAAWLEDMELRDEARKYWKALAAERPDDSKLKSLAME
jgi:hypothetical protein